MIENLPIESTSRVRVAPFLYICIVITSMFVLTWGCVDQRQDPRKAKHRNLSKREWRQVRKNFLTSQPRPQYPLNVTLSIQQGGSKVPAVYVYGVDVNPTPIERGKNVTITYYFKPLRKFRHNWGVFLHTEAGRRHRFYLNKDHHPINGLYPTSRWIPHRIFKSSFSFTLPRDFPGKKVYFYSGFWRGNSRMSVPSSAPTDGKNRLLLATVPVRGKGLQKPIYIAYQIDKAPTIDGKLNEAMWKKLPSTGRWGTYNNRRARFKTWARMAWDTKYLYLGVYCEDDDIWSTYTKRDDPIFHQEVVEFFIDANRNHKDYLELQVSPAGVIFDSFFPRYRWPKPMGQLNFDSGMLVKVYRKGTLNNPKDKDSYFTVEMRLPLAKLGPAPNIPPKNGDEWLINFFRFERSRRSRGEAQAWSPVTLSNKGGDFHQIQRFGTLRFSTRILRFNTPQTTARIAPKPAQLVVAPRLRTKPTARPIIQPTKPTARPIIRRVKPATRPIVQPAKPATRPIVQPAKPATRPIVQPTKPATRPIVRRIKPRLGTQEYRPRIFRPTLKLVPKIAYPAVKRLQVVKPHKR